MADVELTHFWDRRNGANRVVGQTMADMDLDALGMTVSGRLLQSLQLVACAGSIARENKLDILARVKLHHGRTHRRRGIHLDLAGLDEQ